MEYGELSYEALRNLVLNDEVDNEKMNLCTYEFLLDNEAKLSKPSAVVLEFCIAGLKQFEKYAGIADVVIYGNAVVKHIEAERASKQVTPEIIIVKPKRKRIAFYVIAGVFVLTLAGCAAFTDFYRWLLGVSPLTTTDYQGDKVTWTGTRTYGSLEEMLMAENLNILYPSKLPDGYAFTDFRITDFGDDLEVQMYASEPHIAFSIKIGAGIQIDDFDYEANGIEYSIFETGNELYQAIWSNNGDYYWIIVGDKAIISSIIENLVR